MNKSTGQLNIARSNELHPFNGLAGSTYSRLCERMTTRVYRKGERLLVPGQVQTEMYFVREGMQMSYYEKGDKLHVMAFTHAPGICVVANSFALQEPSKYTLICLSASTLDCITFNDLHSLFTECPDLERLFRIVTTQMLAGALDHSLELKTSTIEERFRHFCHRNTHLLNRVPHKYLASYLNIDATNFSKLFNSVRIA